jgi:hypothetical protein
MKSQHNITYLVMRYGSRGWRCVVTHEDGRIEQSVEQPTMAQAFEEAINRLGR